MEKGKEGRERTGALLQWLKTSAVYVFFAYLITLLFHKALIVYTSLWLNSIVRSTGYQISWKRMLLHDQSKFSFHEFWPYAQYFFGPDAFDAKKTGFDKAWKHHYLSNDHHHEFFSANPNHEPKVMPMEALLEQVADHYAATRSYAKVWPTKDAWDWLEKNFSKKAGEMHPFSAVMLAVVFCKLGHEGVLTRALRANPTPRLRLTSEGKIDWNEAIGTVKARSPELTAQLEALLGL